MKKKAEKWDALKQKLETDKSEAERRGIYNMNASGISEATSAGGDYILSRGSTNDALSNWLPTEESTHCCKQASALSVQGQRGRGGQKVNL